MYEPLRVEHRGVKIRCGYDIQNDQHRAYFELPPRAPEFQQAVQLGMSQAAGTTYAEDPHAQRAIEKAKSMIDAYLDS